MAGLSREESISKYGTERYTGWSEPEAGYDAAALGITGGGGGGGTVDSILNSAISAFTALFPKKLEDYEKVNPFFFDEQLAKEASTAEYAPYYNEILSDYIADVERTKSRSAEDLEVILDQLSAGKEYYTGRERRVLDKALRMVNEGYAGKGLFFSGARERDARELQQEYDLAYGPEGYETGRYQYQTGRAQTAYERGIEDIGIERERKERDVGREKEYAIETGVLQRKRETREEYELGRQKYYEQAFYPSIV